MLHILFALFDNEEEAASAVRELEEEGIPMDLVSLLVRKDKLDEEDLDINESDARNGFFKGILAGGTVGALVGFLLGGPFGLLGVGPLASALFGAGAGSVYGSLGGALSGASVTDDQLDKLAGALEAGKILVTAEIEGIETVEAVTEIFERHGAVGAAKALMGRRAGARA